MSIVDAKPWLGATLLVVGFVTCAGWLRLVGRSRDVSTAGAAVLADLRNASLDDEQRERAMQANGKRLLSLAFVIFAIGATCVLLPMGLLWLLDRAGVLPLRASIAVAVSIRFMIGSAVLMSLALLLPRGRRTPRTTAFENRYGTLDRAVHRLAFLGHTSQLALADMEDRMFPSREVPAAPVFVTALPRAGTTLVLDLLVRTGELGSHTYRDMPFVLAPLLWDRFSRRFRVKATAAQERAHGDGMMIDVDSPEAFEEVAWRAFWPTHYAADRIRPWGVTEADSEFSEFLRAHVRKIVALRHADRASVARYVSKNNLNIARLGTLLTCFPDAVVVVPFRDPVQHAGSLLRQHLNFSKIHSEDAFSKRYMADIGHYDFGDNLRPVDFDGWLGKVRCPDPRALGFWLEYWVATYRQILADAAREPRIHLLSYDRLCAEPASGLAALARVARLADATSLVAQQASLRVEPARDIDLGMVPPEVLEAVRTCHAALDERALPFDSP